MAGEIGKTAAEEVKGKLEIEEQRKLLAEDNETYDKQLFQHLQEKLQPEFNSFNQQAEPANQITLETGSNNLQFFRGNKPVYAVLIQNRELLFLDPASTVPSKTLGVSGGTEEYIFHGGSDIAAPIAEEDLLKGLLRLAAGATFQE